MAASSRPSAYLVLVLPGLLAMCRPQSGPAPGTPVPPREAGTTPAIDRHALVARHSPSLSSIDPSAPFMVGNGSLALTADITGLSTFQSRYSPLVPLMIQAQWAWHSFPNPGNYGYEQSLVPVDVRGKMQLYPWLHDWSEAAAPAIAWLRANPHRFSLGRLSFHLATANHQPLALDDLVSTRQTLDLWTGRLQSSFAVPRAVLEKSAPGAAAAPEANPAGSEVVEAAEVAEAVEVETSVYPDRDIVIVQLRSALLARGQLGIDLTFPGVAAQLNPDPADWSSPDSHHTTLLEQNARGVRLERQLDATRYRVEAQGDRDVRVEKVGPHGYRVTAPGETALTLLVSFSESGGSEARPEPLPAAEEARAAVARHWESFWTEGGAVDFSGSTDPRAPELERRVVLSRYLMALNAAGHVPPQEEGLFSNSWNGKFHVEMHPWHAAHFATWGQGELLERSMGWYIEQLPNARARASAHGARGAWWPKMVGPEGRESPSTVNPFIMWQQPHPIYLAELLYRAHPDAALLERYRELVFATADLLASFPHHDDARGVAVLGPPIIPAQEVFPPLATYNPTFELEYFRFGLATAQLWRERLGLPPDATWQAVFDDLAPLPQKGGLFLATESQPELWEQARSPGCSGGQTSEACLNRDHPSFLAALGLLPGTGVDAPTMQRTLDAVLQHWDLRQTWGWDFPMLAMTAARLHRPERAVDLLMTDSRNFRFGRSGMTPRVHLDDASRLTTGASPDGPGFRRAAETYFPSNGALLLAVGMMAAGWDGERAPHPGFPNDGSWRVRSEGIYPLP